MSWRNTALVCSARVLRPILRLPIPWSVHRRAVRAMAGTARRTEGIETALREIGGCPCTIFTPSDAAGTLLWLHGGGFVVGSARMYAGLAAALARASGRQVIVPDYRLAPEHPYPAAPDDCRAVARAVARDGPFALGGDSAGGTLALVTLRDLMDQGTPPEALVLICPAVDLDPGRPVQPHPGEVLFHPSVLRRVVRDYVVDADPRDPRVSPIHGSYAGAPPTLVQCAQGEILEGDSDAIADRLRAGGARVTVQKTAGVPHVWQFFAGHTPEADAAADRIGAFLRGVP